MPLTHLLPLIIAALGAIYWVVMCCTSTLTSHALVRIVDQPLPVADTADLPSLSIIVAARNESATIEAGIATLSALIGDDLQIVLVNDRSTDTTGSLMDAAAARDARISVVHVTELPEGWLGKVNALQQGLHTARGEWLLFTDADVELHHELPLRALTTARDHRLDALALLPEVGADSWLVAGAVATFSRWLIIGTGLWRAADADAAASFGVGACNFVRRTMLDESGGLVSLRMDIADDAALAQLIAARDGRTMLASGIGLVRVTWQTSIREMTRGFEKYGGTGGIGSIRAAFLMATLALVGELAPWIALVAAIVWSAPAAAVVAAATLMLGLAVLAITGRRMGAPAAGTLVQPIAAILVWWMQVRAAALELRRGGVIWRDTFYSTEAVRQGKRYQLPGIRRG